MAKSPHGFGTLRGDGARPGASQAFEGNLVLEQPLPIGHVRVIGRPGRDRNGETIELELRGYDPPRPRKMGRLAMLRGKAT
jgi:hypothetical protein